MPMGRVSYSPLTNFSLYMQLQRLHVGIWYILCKLMEKSPENHSTAEQQNKGYANAP